MVWLTTTSSSADKVSRSSSSRNRPVNASIVWPHQRVADY
jgi:hypothetical protein